MDSGKIIIRQISKLSNKMRRRLIGLNSGFDCSGAEAKALHFLIANSDMDVFQKDIEEEFEIRPSTATVLLQRMENDGFIQRNQSMQDGRLKKIIVTEKGMKYKEEVFNGLAELENALVADIPEEDLATFIRVANQMINKLK